MPGWCVPHAGIPCCSSVRHLCPLPRELGQAPARQSPTGTQAALSPPARFTQFAPPKAGSISQGEQSRELVLAVPRPAARGGQPSSSSPSPPITRHPGVGLGEWDGEAGGGAGANGGEGRCHEPDQDQHNLDAKGIPGGRGCCRPRPPSTPSLCRHTGSKDGAHPAWEGPARFLLTAQPPLAASAKGSGQGQSSRRGRRLQGPR